MTSTISNQSLFLLFGTLAVLVLLNIFGLIFLHFKIKKLLGGTSASSIEDSLVLIRTEQEKMAAFKKEVNRYLETVETRVRRSIQNVETIRFNPFKGTGDGGNQSFSTAFVSENGDGVVVSGLYSRDRVSIFSKPIKKFEAEYELTQEEHDVLKESEKKLSNRAK